MELGGVGTFGGLEYICGAPHTTPQPPLSPLKKNRPLVCHYEAPTHHQQHSTLVEDLASNLKIRDFLDFSFSICTLAHFSDFSTPPPQKRYGPYSATCCCWLSAKSCLHSPCSNCSRVFSVHFWVCFSTH